MSRGKSVTKLLLDSSQSALFAGVEIHNKPHIAYRYPTTVILIINAWELALKAYVYKYIGKEKIYEKEKKEKKDKKYTISFSKALVLVRDDIYSKNKQKQYRPVFENIDLLNEYRCSNVHFAESNLDPIIFMLVCKAVLNYDQFLKDFFQKDITKDDNLIILPVGFKLPFNPIDYLKQDYGNMHNEFVNDVINTVRKLKNDNIQDSIVIGFDVYTASVKKIDNADLVAAIDQLNGTVKLVKQVRITDDPNAPAVRMNDELLPPLTYQDVIDKVKEKRPDIKLNKMYNSAMAIIKRDASLCQSRYLDPKKKKGMKKDYYMEGAVDAVICKYDELQKEGI